MKKLIYIFIGTVVVLTGCETSPHADFSVSDLTIEVGEDIYFYNNSINAFDYEWDFGDGYVAFRINPIHRYMEPGFYEVRLAAMDDNNVDYCYTTIHVVDPITILEIKVLEYYDQYPVPDASIIIYPTYEDWLNETNMIMEVLTDNNGIAVIEGLDPVNYYLDVWHENHDNYALADEDVNFIKVSSMQKGAVNYFTAWVDYVERLKSAKEDRTRVKSTNSIKRNYDVSK